MINSGANTKVLPWPPVAIRLIGERLKKTLYEMGGGTHPRDVFRKFMGRDYLIEALLKQNGLE